MSLEVINLLPPEKKRAFRRSYFMRVGTVAILLAAALVVIHTVLLVPSYIYLNVAKEQRETELATVNAASSAGESEANRRLTALKEQATYLSRLNTTPTASTAVRAVLAVPRQGVKISSITFTPATANAANGIMTIMGTAVNREALRSYNLALSAAPFISKADLPISSYASEANIPFTITVTGTLKP